MNQTIFISGGNRGIGLALVEAYSADINNVVIATARNTAKAEQLQEVAKKNTNVHVVELDVSSEKSIKDAFAAVSKLTKVVDVFISNAGIADTPSKALELPSDNWTKHYNTNVLGPILLFQTFYPLLAASSVKKALFVSSIIGSLTFELIFPGAAYGQSKAALNYTIKEFAKDLKSEGFIIVPVHPGVVSTDMGSSIGEQVAGFVPGISEFFDPSIVITPEKSAVDLKKLTDNLKPEDSGRFWSYDGLELAW